MTNLSSPGEFAQPRSLQVEDISGRLGNVPFDALGKAKRRLGVAECVQIIFRSILQVPPNIYMNRGTNRMPLRGPSNL